MPRYCFLLLKMMVAALAVLAAGDVLAAQEPFNWADYLSEPDLTVTEQFLEIIFQGGTLTDQESGMLSNLSRVLNAAVLIYVVAAVTGGGVGYLIHSANKGTLGGGKISSLWTPLRLAVFIPMLIPLSSGYSACQYLVNGVAHAATFVADEAAKVGVEQIGDHGPPYSLSQWNSRTLVRHAVLSEYCARYMNEEYEAEVQEVVEGGPGPTSPSYSVRYSWNEKGENNNFCGSFKVLNTSANAGSEGEEQALAIYYQDEINALTLMRQSAKAAVDSVLWVNGEYLDFNREQVFTAAEGGQRSDADVARVPVQVGGLASAMSQMEEEYNQRMQDAATKFVNAVKAAGDAENGSALWADEVEKKGFAVLGTYYFSMLKMQRFVRQSMISNTSYSAPTLDNGRSSFAETIAEDDTVFAEAVVAMGDATRAMNRNVSDLGDIDAVTAFDFSDGSFTILSDYTARFTRYLVTHLYKFVVEDDIGGGVSDQLDLVVVMQQIGSVLSSIADAALIVIGIAIIAMNAGVSGIGQSVASWVGGGVVAGALQGLLDLIMTFLVPVLLYLLGLGLFLMYWIPAIPVITWIMSYFGWLILFFTALVTMPMWVATMAVATGDTWMTQHQRQGWVLLFGLFARPTLMVIIYFCVYIFMRVAGYLVMWFMSFVLTIPTTGFTGFLGLLMVISLIAIFAYNLVTRVFSLLPELPDRIMRGLNAGQETFGEQETEIKGRSAAMGLGGNMAGKGLALGSNAIGKSSPRNGGGNPAAEG